MSQNIPFSRAAFVVAVFAAVQFALQANLLTKGVEYAVVSLTIDDTYYYLQTAWNAKMLGLVTFDGLHTTNGVQLLWFAIIYLLAIVAKTKAALLVSTLGVTFLLNGLCYLVVLKIGAVLRQPLLALFMASLWALQSLPFRIYSMGMENSLHAFIFWCVLWQSVEFLIRVQNRDKPNFWSLTVVLILLVWTRLDSVLIVAVLIVSCAGMLVYANRHNLRLYLQGHTRVIAVSAFWAGFGLFAQLAAFRLMGDSYVPVSALVKTSSAGRGANIESIDKLIEVVILGMPSILQGRFPAIALVLLGIFGILLVIRARASIPEQSTELGAFLNLWACLLVGEIMYYASVGFSGVEYTPYFVWYRSPSFIFWIVTGSLIAHFAFGHVGRVGLAVRIPEWAPVSLSLVIFAVATHLFARSIDFASELYATRYDVAMWIARNSPPDAVFASWNAGQLGFFSNRTFINLDGVINNLDYYERVLHGSTSLAEYLLENNVDFIVDYTAYDSIPDFPVVNTFPLNDGSGRSIQIWRVAPEVLSAS